jgi:hypothetical protein
VIISEQAIAEEIAAIFLAMERLHEKGLPISKASKVRREAIHFLGETREEGKLSPKRRHSLAARRARSEGRMSELTYEHSIPLASIMPLLRSAAGDGPAMLGLLRTYIQPVIVTKDEAKVLSRAKLHACLPTGASGDDAMARYRACGIKIEL